MKSTGRQSEKSGYLVILLLVVGLTAFSHSMKELTEVQQLTWDASRLVAQWSGNVTPAEVPQIPQTTQTVVRIEKRESCESRQSIPSVDLSGLTESTAVAQNIPRQTKALRIERRATTTTPDECEIAKLKRLQRTDIDTHSFEVRIPTVQMPDSDEPVTTEFPAFTFKSKTRKPGAIRINPRDREILLKTLNRSINLRTAS